MPEYRSTVLKVTGVSLAFGDKSVLRGVTFEVKDVVGSGQKIGLLGPSGVGKTQLLQIISGLQQNPYGGTVEIFDKDGHLVPVTRGKMGMVFQTCTLFPHYTVLGNLIVAGRQAGMSAAEARERAFELMQEFDIAECANRYPVGDQVSGGQRQRVAIAQQAMCSEHFLLMDEPFAALDPIATEKACQKITQFADKNELNTAIIVSHDITATCMVADTLHLLGRERTLDGTIIPGAFIKKTYDLIERGLAWRKGLNTTPEFATFVREVREEYRTL